jgi:uncharacterized Zn-finger protein
MADRVVPRFHNDPGARVVHVGAHEFQCIGAKPPFDHPHVFLDMGEDDEIICGYCATLFRYRDGLRPQEADPAECAYLAPDR